MMRMNYIIALRNEKSNINNQHKFCKSLASFQLTAEASPMEKISSETLFECTKSSPRLHILLHYSVMCPASNSNNKDFY